MSQAQSGLVGQQTQPPAPNSVCLNCWEGLELGFGSDHQGRDKTVYQAEEMHNDRRTDSEVFGIWDSFVWRRPWGRGTGKEVVGEMR